MHGFLGCLMIALALAACSGKSGKTPGQDDTAATAQRDVAATPESTPEGTTEATAAEAAVRKAFEDYKAAIMERRGKDAVALVDSNTLDFYATCRDLALTARRDTLVAETLFRRMTALLLRLRLSEAELAVMDAPKLVAHAVDSGWIGSNVGDVGIADIAISGDMATATSQIAGAPDQVTFVFRRQDGAWKIDLTAIFSYAEQGLRQSFAQMGMEENQALIEVLGMMSSEAVPESIWEPLR